MYIGERILDLMYPPTPHEQLLRTLPDRSLVPKLTPRRFGSVVTLFDYHDPCVQAAIAGVKFEHSRLAAHLLGKALTHWLATLPPRTTAIIPVPLHPKRERERGYNQVARVLECLGPLPYPTTHVPRSLARRVYTTPQTSLNRYERHQNPTAAFTGKAAHAKRLASFERIILCDDVITTGATMGSAHTALRAVVPEPAEILLLAFAH